MQPRITRITPNLKVPPAALAAADHSPPDWSTQAFTVTLEIHHPQFAARCRQMYPGIDLNKSYNDLAQVRNPAREIKTNGLNIIETHLLYTIPWPGHNHDWRHRLLPLHCHQEYATNMNRLQEQRIAKTIQLSEAVYRLTNSPEPGMPHCQEAMTTAFRDETKFSWRIDTAPDWERYLASCATRFPWTLLTRLKIVCPDKKLTESREAYRQTARRLPRHDPMETSLGFYAVRDQFTNNKQYYKALRNGDRFGIFSKTKDYPRRIKNPRGL